MGANYYGLAKSPRISIDNAARYRIESAKPLTKLGMVVSVRFGRHFGIIKLISAARRH
jgi:hypothetical protein